MLNNLLRDIDYLHLYMFLMTHTNYALNINSVELENKLVSLIHITLISEAKIDYLT